MNYTEISCAHCGQSLGRLMLLALLVDSGCEVAPGPLFCASSPTGKHDFEPAKATEIPVDLVRPAAKGQP
jgi:hypothetical protein